MCYTGLHYLLLKFCQKFSTYYWVIKYLQLHLIFSYFSIVLYTVDPIYRGAWGPSSATAIYPDRDISWGGSLLRRR